MEPTVKAMFKEQLRVESNRSCADCGERNPTWASVRCVTEKSESERDRQREREAQRVSGISAFPLVLSSRQRLPGL